MQVLTSLKGETCYLPNSHWKEKVKYALPQLQRKPQVISAETLSKDACLRILASFCGVSAHLQGNYPKPFERGTLSVIHRVAPDLSSSQVQ